MMPATTPDASAWEFLLSELTPQTRAMMEGTSVETTDSSDDGESFDSVLDDLTPATREMLAGPIDPLAAPASLPKGTSYGLFESPDGEWATVRMFRNAEDLARRISELEGQDIVVLPFVGIPLALTKGSPRHLLLPDNATAAAIPLAEGLPVELVSVRSIADKEIQEDGYLGHPAMTERIPLNPKKTKAAVDDEED